MIAGAVADALGYGGAIALVAGLTAGSGLWVLRDMPSERRRSAAALPHTELRPVDAAAHVEAGQR